MIYINYDGPASLMLHTKFHGNWPTGSGEEDFLKVFTIYSHGGHLGHVTWTIYINFRSPFLRMLHINLALIGQTVSEEKIFEIVDDGDDDRAWVYYKLT